jgi:hypothetical protein
LPLRAGVDEVGTVQEKFPKFITIQEVILQRRPNGIRRQQLEFVRKIPC